MKHQTSLLRASALAITIAAFGSAAQAESQAGTPKATDNTQINQRDQRSDELTADQAGENPADRENARKIRRAVVQEKGLSVYAQNVKIISRDGKVTLKGPVRSQSEKATLLAKATDVVGTENVLDEMSIEPKNDKKTNN